MDVRDRFRNRYPEKYAEAGYKTRSKSFPKSPLRTSDRGEEETDRPMSPSSSINVDSGLVKENRQRSAVGIVGSLNTADEIQVSNSSLSDFGDTSLPAFSSQGTGESEIQRLLLDHIHPLATWNASRPPALATTSSILISSAEPQDRTENDTIEPSLHTSAQQNSQQTLPNLPKSSRAQPLFLSALPPLLDPLDATLTSSASTFLNYKASDASKRVSPPDSAGGRNLNNIPDIPTALNWEDMATHPMFDIDAAVGGGDESGPVKGK
jgi:hypothetical protein